MSEDLKAILEDVQRLDALKHVRLLDSPAESSFDRLTQLASTLLDAPVSLISLVEPDRQFFKSQVGLAEPYATDRETPISHSFCQYVVASGEPLIIEDARLHPILKDNPAIEDLGVVSYLGIPLTSPDGWHLGSFCVIDNEPRQWSEQDVETMKTLAASVSTEIELRLEARMKETLLQQLEARNEELDAFAHTVSHNLKNPISAIIGWSSVSTQYSQAIAEGELLETIAKMGYIAQQTNDIINALMLLATISRSDDIPIQELNMHNIIDDALARLELEITDYEAVINLPESGAFPRCLGYRPWVEEVWMNYITNALKYGGTPPELTFGAETQQDNRVRYWIQDNGNGLTEDDQRKLFIPFSRLPTTAKLEGHGLGLSIVQRIIDKLDGEVGLSSVVGEGSIFSFTLPAS